VRLDWERAAASSAPAAGALTSARSLWRMGGHGRAIVSTGIATLETGLRPVQKKLDTFCARSRCLSRAQLNLNWSQLVADFNAMGGSVANHRLPRHGQFWPPRLNGELYVVINHDQLNSASQLAPNGTWRAPLIPPTGA
jgi:hypothetical protein